MKIEKIQGREYWTVESGADLAGFDCHLNREYKPGVHIIHATRKFSNGATEMRILYCPTEILAEYAESQKPGLALDG